MRNAFRGRSISRTFESRTSTHGKRLLWSAAILAITAAASARPVHAQSQTQNRIDFQQIRNSVGDRRLSGGGGTADRSRRFFNTLGEEIPPPPDHINFVVQAPFLFNTNADQSPTGGTNSFETTPSAHFDLHSNVPALQMYLQAGVDASFDRFTNTTVSNTDSIVGGVLLQYRSLDDSGNRKDDQELTPFFKYGPQWGYAPFLSTQTSAVHDFTIGFGKAYAFDGKLKRIEPPVSDATKQAIWTASLQAFGTRRIAETGASSFRLHASPQLIYAWTNTPDRPTTDSQWSATLGVDVDRQTFDGSSQENWTLTPVLSIEYDFPARWFGDQPGKATPNYVSYGAPRLIFQAAYNWVGSNVAGAGSSQWTFGPMLQAGWKF
jgi:hypothetical protein